MESTTKRALVPFGLAAVFLAAAAVSLYAPAAASAPPDAAVITGRVLHGETGAPVAGIEVRVLGMEAGQELVERVTNTDRTGRFTLRVDVVRRAYLIQALYRGVVYTSGPHQADGNALRVTLRVYETTEDPSGLYVARRATLVEQTSAGALDVREVVVVGNALPRTYVGQTEGGRRATLRLPLPAGARDVSVRQGMALLGQDPEGALVDSLPVTPGERQIVLTYQIPVLAENVAVRLPVQLPTLAMDVFLASPLTANSDALPKRENRTVQDRRVLRLAGSDLAPGTTVAIQISGIAPSSPAIPPAVGVAALGLLVVIVAVLPWLRANRHGH
jgi:hypothetical protein